MSTMIKLNKNKKRSVLLLIFSIVLLNMLPNLIIGNQRDGEISNNERRDNDKNIPLIPQESTTYYENTAGVAYDVYLSGGYAYIADGNSGLAIIMVLPPSNPGTPIYKDTNGTAFGVYVLGDYAYVADGGSGLAVINVSDPTNPKLLVYENTAGNANGVYVSGDYAYVADGASGLAIIDISDPTNPGVPVYEVMVGGADDVFVSGNYAYVADGGSGLAVINVSDPTNPKLLVYENTVGNANGVYVSGDYAYVADGVSGLAIIDISDPTNPGVPVYEDTTGGANNVYARGFYTYVADGVSGLGVIFTPEIVAPVLKIIPDDFSVDFGYTGVNISWTATDQYPYNYTISLQGTGIVSGPNAWSNGTAIIYNIPNGLNLGEYIYTINITNDYNNSITNTVTMTVIDVLDPVIITSPDNFTIDFGYTGVNISWTATDQTPYKYTIRLQGEGIIYGPNAWSSGTPITYYVPDDLDAGEYTYTINILDLNDHFVNDTVTMTINAESAPATIPYGNFYLIFLFAGIISVVIIQTRRKKFH